MRCTKLEVTILFGVGVFLIGTVSLVAVTVHNVFPAREEQNLKAINCTIASANMQAKAKCQHKTRDDSSYRCLRVMFCVEKTQREMILWRGCSPSCYERIFTASRNSAPMNRKNAMTRLKRTPNCWCRFKARIATLLDHPYSVFTTRKTPTKWSARKLQKKATTKWC